MNMKLSKGLIRMGNGRSSSFRSRPFTTAVLVCFAGLVTLRVSADSNLSVIEREPFTINSSSFSTYFGTSADNLILGAAAAWTWGAAGKGLFDYRGESAADSCSNATENVVVGRAACHAGDPNCVTLGQFTRCRNAAAWVASIYLPAGSGHHMAEPTATGVDLHAAVQHELGHVWLGHVDPPGGRLCNMNAMAVHDDKAQRYFCDEEIDALGSSAGHAEDTMNVLRQHQYSCDDLDPGGEFWEYGTCQAFGIAFGDIERGFFGSTPVDLAFAGATTSSDHRMGFYDYNTYACFAGSSSAQETHIKTSLAYDPTRSKWWAFVVRPDTNAVRAFYSVSTSLPPHWNDLGDIAPGGTPIVTRNGVGSAYDPHSDRIVVAIEAFHETASPPCPPPFGCAGDVNTMSIEASATSNTFVHGGRLGNDLSALAEANTFGVPAVACGGDANDCEVVYTATNPQRSLRSHIFGIKPDSPLPGTLVSPSAGSMDGTALGPVSLDNHDCGGITAAIAGVDRRIYVNRRGGTTWSGWAALTPERHTSFPPILRFRSGYNYEIVYAPMP